METIFRAGLFEGEVALVTGGGTGIGFAIAKELGALGAKVAISGRRPEPLEKAAESSGNARAALLAKTLDEAVGDYLENSRYPSRKVNEIDNRGSSFYLTLYWARALAAQDEDAELKARFAPVAAALAENEATISAELLAAQGDPVDLGGYFRPDPERCAAAMRPSATFNRIIDEL